MLRKESHEPYSEKRPMESLEIASTIEEISNAEERIKTEALSEKNGWSEDEFHKPWLAIREAIVNAVTHGNHLDPKKTVRIEYAITPEKIVVAITDQGEGFDPRSIPDPRSPEGLEKTSGRGVFLMEQLGKARYEKTEGGFTVTLEIERALQSSQ